MGCGTSKLDDLPAVTLCRERCRFLEEAIQQRYSLADAHINYINSLKEIGLSLDRFFNQDMVGYNSLPLPVINLPPQKKVDSNPVITQLSSSPTPVFDYKTHNHHHSHSSSGSHIQFHSDDEDDDDDDEDDESLHHSGNSSPLHNKQEIETQTGGRFMSMNYMKNQTTQSVVYQQRPMSPDTVHMTQDSSTYYPYAYPNQGNPNPYSYYNNNNSNYPPVYSNYGFYGSAPPAYGSVPPAYGSVPPAYGSSPPLAVQAGSSSKPPPPPPSPPRDSPWGFLNPFETVEKYYPPATPGRNSKDVREEEGIPDLEDEYYHDEVVKEVHGHQKFSDGGGKNHSKMVVDEIRKENLGEAFYQVRPSASAGKEIPYDVNLVDKVVVQTRSEERGSVSTSKARGVHEVIREIRAHFNRAAESADEVSEILEVGHLQHRRRNAVYQASSKILHSITPSLSVVSSKPSTSNDRKSSASAEIASSSYMGSEENRGTSSSKISSTLQKLYIWEKKLYAEVKSEEKMRITHERKSKRLKRLVEKGAENPKIDSTRTLVRTLSTKIRIAIQVVDKISIKINKLRDEELWPEIKELINVLVRMWKIMLECHQSQCGALAEAKNLDASASNRKLSDANLEATLQLEKEMLSWTLSFFKWISAQKGYVRALNNWLLNCLFYEPEETVDGVRPFSPSSIGAPPIFVICHQWAQAMGRISEEEVIDAMWGFCMNVLELWKQHSLEMRNRLTSSIDKDKREKVIVREEKKMQRTVQALEKQIFMVSGNKARRTTSSSSLSSGLTQIFDSMERFTANSVQAYEELLVRIEEDRGSRETKVS